MRGSVLNLPLHDCIARADEEFLWLHFLYSGIKVAQVVLEFHKALGLEIIDLFQFDVIVEFGGFPFSSE